MLTSGDIILFCSLLVSLFRCALPLNIVHTFRSSNQSDVADWLLQNRSSVDWIQHQQTTQRLSRQQNELTTARGNCSFAEDELDRCSSQLIVMGQTSAYPNDMEELQSAYCPAFKRLVSCIGDSAKCYKPFERQIISWILSSTRRLNYKRCKNQDEQVKFLRLTSTCLSGMDHSCMRNYISSLEAIADLNESVRRLSEEDIQIQLSCCANRQFKRCVMNSAKQQCKSQHQLSSRRHRSQRANSSFASRRQITSEIRSHSADLLLDELRTTLDKVTLTGPEFICANLDDTFCADKFSGHFRGRAPRHKSILPAMIRIYSNHAN